MELEQLIQKFRNQEPTSMASYEEPDVNRLDAPLPGQSLTDEPGNYPWEHPPKTPSIEEATDYVYESIMKPENMERMFTLLRMGIPIEALVKIITFSGFLEGRWTVDTAKLLEPIVAMMVAGEAAIAEIPAKVNMGDAENTDFFRDMAERKIDMKQAKEMPMIEMDEPAPQLGLMAKGEKYGNIYRFSFRWYNTIW